MGDRPFASAGRGDANPPRKRDSEKSLKREPQGMSLLPSAVIPVGNTACLLRRWRVPATLRQGGKDHFSHFQGYVRPSGFGPRIVEVVVLTLMWNRLTGTAGETFFWCVQLNSGRLRWCYLVPSLINQLNLCFLWMGSFISMEMCVHMCLCVCVHVEKRITLLPSPYGLYHMACLGIQCINSFIRNLK